ARLRGRAPAADQVFGEHQLLRHRICALAQWAARGAGFVPRQSFEGRRRSGSAELEPDVRLRRERGTAMKLVVKIGGAALDDKELVSKFAKTIPDLCREGHKLVIVHGGGAALSRTLKQLGCQTTFIDGLRVTDSKTRDVAMMVLAGQLNKQLAAAIGDEGQPSIGICGGDLRIFRDTRKTQPDLGYVGEVCAVDFAWIERLWSLGVVPVVVRNWSYEIVEREVRANVVYRSFCRIGLAKVPDEKT